MKTKTYTATLILFLIIGLVIIPMFGLGQKQRTSQSTDAEYLPGAIVIKVKDGIGPFEKQEGNINFGIASLDKLASQFEVEKLGKRFKHKPIQRNSGLPDLSRIYRIEFPESQNVHQVAKEFAADPNIEYAEAVPIHRLAEVPNDPAYTSQQHLPQIMAEDAWDIHKGEDGDEVIVAIVDTGTDWLHSDLVENCWQNLGEDADGDGVTLEYNGGVWERDPDDLNNIDDDGNGYVDDLIGWDFWEAEAIGDGSNPDPYPHTSSHGTHCAGIAAGRTNNGVGISSISYNVKYMPVKTDDGNYLIYGYDGIIYAAENGADIISNSWSSVFYSEANQEVIDYAAGLGSIVVAAASNNNTDVNAYPAAYTGSISVAAVNPDDTRASFSNYGAYVDIAAPGVDILSTVINNNYARWEGTSMATPMVAGLFGLLKSYQPAWTNDHLIEQLIATADNIDDLNPGYEKALGSGRINAYHALVDENVEVPQELKLEFLGLTIEDEDGDNIIEAGETVSFSISMRNYAHLVNDDNAEFTLISFDPDIIITSGSVTADIPADSIFEINDAFEFKVAESAEAHFTEFILEVSSDMPVIYGSETEITALVEPSGFFVWEGDPEAPDYSGAFIKDYLEARGYDVLYSNYYPRSFTGFDAVFLSFGNIDQGQDKATLLQYSYTVPIQNYLGNFIDGGGTLYTEGAPFLSVPAYFEYPNGDDFAGLFGVESMIPTFSENPISKLTGSEGTLSDGMIFNTSNQQYNWYIDNIIPDEGATVPFTEEGYGNVSIYNEGDYGQKTFHFGYSLAELVDEDPHSSRYNILVNVLEFFGYAEGDGYVVANFTADKTEGEPNLVVHFTDWSLVDEGYEITAWAWDFDEDGEFDSYDQNPIWTYSDGGIFDVKLVVSGDADSDTLVKKDFIIVRSGILVYEGKENENGYSGTFIRDYLEDQWADEVSYTNTFPASLEGYNAVFLSFGNTGLRSTKLSSAMADAINNYGLSGGSIYLEGGDVLQSFFNKPIFGILGVQDGENNPIDGLIGQEEAETTYGMHFNSTNQLSQRSIDSYTIYDDIESLKVAFEESDYGAVAVEFDGTQLFGQKTFCMSYAIADLEDGEGMSTRNELLRRILEFLDVPVSVEDQLTEEPEQLINVYPNPASEQVNIEFSLEQDQVVSVEIFDLTGRLVSKEENSFSKGVRRIAYNIRSFRSGIYYVRVKAGEEVQTVKWVKVD